jgi:hypothetical protein
MRISLLLQHVKLSPARRPSNSTAYYIKDFNLSTLPSRREVIPFYKTGESEAVAESCQFCFRGRWWREPRVGGPPVWKMSLEHSGSPPLAADTETQLTFWWLGDRTGKNLGFSSTDSRDLDPDGDGVLEKGGNEKVGRREDVRDTSLSICGGGG